MIGIYLLVSIFVQMSPLTTQLSSALSWSPIDGAPVTQSVEFALNFDELNGVHVGTPVLSDGYQVGSVTRISSTETKQNSFEVAVSVRPLTGMKFNLGTVGLQALPVSASRLKPETVLELFSLPGESTKPLKGGEKLTGYPSLEKFWSAGLRARS